MASQVLSVIEQLAVTGIQLLLHQVIKNPTSAKAKQLRHILADDVKPLVDEALSIIPE